MKIFIIYKNDYPWDVRVEKIAETAHELGHEVEIIANNFDKKDRIEIVKNLKIIRVPGLNFMPNFIGNYLKLPFWFNPLWKRILDRNIDENSVIIVRDLPLLKLAVLVGRRKKCRVIYDMAEVYPEMYRSMAQLSRQSFIQKILKSPSLAEKYERDNISKVDHVFTMIEESRNRLLENGLKRSKVSIVSNTPRIDTQSIILREHKGNALNIVYVGFLTELRGLDLLIEGVAEYIELVRNEGRSPDINVHIIGKGNAKENLNALVTHRNLENFVNIYGWLSKHEVDSILENANIGALTYRICGHWNHTIPNKIFDYMAAGLPVLATNVIPIKRIITETNCGLISEPADPKTIAKSLLMLENAELRSKLGKNGQNSISKKYNWSNEKEKIRRILNGFNE